MGVILGTLTTKDGQVIPLPTAADVIDMPQSDEYRKEEEKRYRGCLKRPLPGQVWGLPDGMVPGDVVQYDHYKVETENLKRHWGETTMIDKDKMYESGSYRLFEAYFKRPNVWLSSRELSSYTGVGISSISTLIKRSAEFLVSEGLMKEKDDPRTAKGVLRMFVGQCEKPEEEAKLWYAKMVESNKKKKTKLVLRPGPAASGSHLPLAQSALANVQIDTQTMDAIIRVPLAKLAEVLKVIS